MDYMTIKDAAERWGLAVRTVNLHIHNKRIPGAVKMGNTWLIPADAEKPPDGRRKVHKLKEEKSKGKGGEDA